MASRPEPAACRRGDQPPCVARTALRAIVRAASPCTSGCGAVYFDSSTGLEDYAGGAWAFQDELRADPPPTPLTFSAPYFGYPHYSHYDLTKASPFASPIAPQHGLYRWHLLDPIIFASRLQVTLQQIGAWDHGLFERSDDISTVAYWYQTGPHALFPDLPLAPARHPR